MMDNTKIEVGYALPKERWREAADNLQTAAPYIANEQGWKDALDNLKNAPAAAVAPVRHGRWENRQGGFWGVATCSVCGKKSHIGKVSPPYCPNCGAKMDWEDGDEMASTDSMEKTEIAPARISDSAKIALCKELIGDFYTCANCESIDAVNMLLANLLTTLEFGEEKPVLMQTEDGEKWSS